MRTAAIDKEENPAPPKPIVIAPPLKAKEAFSEQELLPLTLEEIGGVSRSSIPVPCNVYGGVAMCAMLQEVDTVEVWFHRCGEAYMRLILSHTIQVLLMLGLAQLNSWQTIAIDSTPGKQCYEVAWWFFVPCTWVFVASVMKEIIDTMDMCELILFRVPTVEGHTQILKYRTGADGNIELASGGMSKPRKALLSLIVLLPRLGLAIAMLLVGGTFLLTAGSNTDLLMNCLAANFILDSDELVFAFLTPAKTQRLIEAIPPFETDKLTWMQGILRRFSFLAKLILSSLIVLLMFLIMPECVLDPCEGAVELNVACPII